MSARSSLPSPSKVIFLLSNFTYPPREGQHVNHVLLMQGLTAAGFDVGLVTIARDAAQIDLVALKAELPGLAPLLVLPSRLNYPLLLLRHLLPWPVPPSQVVRALTRVVQQHPAALIHLEGIGLLPLVSLVAGQPTVVTTTDAWSLRQQRLAQRASSGLLRLALQGYAAVSAWAERRFFPRAGAVQVVSPADAAYLRTRVPKARIVCIPIALPAILAKPCGDTAEPERSPLVLFWGDIRVPHIADGLRWLLTQVVPLVRGRAQWVVLGRGQPPAALQAAAPGVQFVGWVDDIDEFLRTASVVVLPDAEGTGLKNRAVHAMACGVPVVGTPAAFEGFAVVDGQDAMVRDTPQTFAAAVDQLLGSADVAQKVAQAGRQFAVQGYGQAAVAARWAEVYRAVLQGEAPPP